MVILRKEISSWKPYACLRKTYDELRNHLSVPSLSERAAIASLYLSSIEVRSRRVPYGRKRVDHPVKGAGGVGRTVSMDREVVVG